MSNDGSWLRRSYDGESTLAPAAPGSTLLIAFGGLAGRLGGAGGVRTGDRHQEAGHAGQPAHEFVAACTLAGATHTIFCRDLQQAWYLRGTPEQPRGGFAAVVAALREEVAVLRPARIVTLGASMGGYAAIRVALALGASAAVAFAPQVLVDSTASEAAELPRMPFDELLRHLKRVLWLEGQAMTSLVEDIGASSGLSTEIELHVGARERGDVMEAEMLRAAVDAARGGASPALSIDVRLWPGRDHNVVTALRDGGELHDILARWCAGPGGEAGEAARACDNAS